MTPPHRTPARQFQPPSSSCSLMSRETTPSTS
jgi:hypothetical protein